MEENLSQFTEEEYVSKYNYEDFVRIIKKDENSISKPNNHEEVEYKENQKDIFINTTHSSDLTSVSLSQAENMSQTSDNMLIYGDTRLNNISENQNEENNDGQDLDYFSGIEDYFRKIYPEKFNEYKNSRNYLPKKRRDMNQNTNKNNIIKDNLYLNDNNIFDKNQTNNTIFQPQNNLFYYPINGNCLYYMYNNFCFNIFNIQAQSQKEEENKIDDKKANQNKNDVKKETEETKISSDETEKEKNKRTKIDEDEDEYEHIFIIKRKNNKNFNKNINNKNNFIKPVKQERTNEKRNRQYNHYNCNYNNNNRNNYYYNNDNYNKFNGNYEKRKKRPFFENNFHKKKHIKEIYY